MHSIVPEFLSLISRNLPVIGLGMSRIVAKDEMHCVITSFQAEII
jgi:hypothetical protein